MRALIVDDDSRFRRVTAIALEEAGFEYEDVADGESALAVLEERAPGHFDVVLLDIEMPGLSGWDLLLAIRETGRETPVIFVTGRETVQERVRGLRSGADDYLVKPVEYEELVARVDAVVRRRRSLPTIHWEDLSLDLARRVVERAGSPVELSPREYDLLFALVQADGEPRSRQALLCEVWDMDFDTETNVIDVHIGRLRKKLNRLGTSLIETVRGEGYRMIRPD